MKPNFFNFFLTSVIACGAALAVPVVAGPIYSDVDANGRRVFSDAQTTSSSEVKLNEGTVVSGQSLGKKVDYAYGRPDSGRGSAATYRQASQQEEKKRECADMKDTMNNTAGRIKLNTENRYHRECILGQ